MTLATLADPIIIRPQCKCLEIIVTELTSIQGVSMTKSQLSSLRY